MNPTVMSAVDIREDASEYVIRYGIENDRYAEVFSSVSSCSVLLLGVTWDGPGKGMEGEPPFSVIAVIPLTASVNPDQTAATFEGNDLVLRLVKCGKPIRTAVCQ